MTWIEEGTPNAPLWLVGEAPGHYEIQRHRPFVGPTGSILDSCLMEVGIQRSDCFLTNICHERPPTYTDKHGKRIENDIEQFFLSARDAKASGMPSLHGRFPDAPIRDGLERLSTLIATHKPRVIVLLGNTPLWGLVGETGITKWRGSITDIGDTRTIAAFHPADCLPARSPQHRPLLIHDLTRAKRELACLSPPPAWHHCIEPEFVDVRDWFGTYQGALTCDIETRWGQIACIGFAASSHQAICIPFMRAISGNNGASYWSLEDEFSITSLLINVLATRDITFHNGLFDCQYIARQWGILPRYTDDTMVMQHVAFPGLLGGKIDPVNGRVDKRGSSLSLAFISSICCSHYRFWKDDGRLFDPTTHDERRLWAYNCEDCCRTHECKTVLETILERANLVDQYRFEMSCMPVTFKMMFRGLAIDTKEMNAQHRHILHEMRLTRTWINEVLGYDFNPESNTQMRALFYNDLMVPLRRDKHTRNPSLKDFDLERIKQSNPLLGPLIENIQKYRTLDTIKDDLVTTRLSSDGRLRTALNPAYVETFRYSSNETAFGEGGNLQNIPRSPE